MQINPPYLMFLGDVRDQLAAKTAHGIVDWRPEWCLGQMRLPGCGADLGIADLTIAEAKAKGVKTLIVGVANAGGVLPAHWSAPIVAAIEAGMDIASGLHMKLGDNPEIAAAAHRHGRALFDVRHTNQRFDTGKGTKRSGLRLLTVGTDCSAGKKYTALALEKEMRARGLDADFRATGQTGIFISGRGVAIDAVVADFISGAVEWLSPGNDAGHWDVIEGQGSLFHPSFAGVTLGLLHGAQPDAFVVCHEPTRTTMRGVQHPLPTIQQVIDLTIACGQLTNPAIACVGIAINTKALDEVAARKVLAETGAAHGLPAVDPVRFGVGSIVDRIEAGLSPVTLGQGEVMMTGFPSLSLHVSIERFPIVGAFTISRGSRTEAVVVRASVSDGTHAGNGECVPYPRYGETVEGVVADIELQAKLLASGGTQADLTAGLKAGAARNALDCALWDLAAKRAGKRAWELTGTPAPKPVTTCYTLSLGDPASMQAAAKAASHRPLLKVKLGGEGDVARIAAVRLGAPKSRIVVDANESWTPANFAANVTACAAAGVELIEQPFPAADDGALAHLDSPIPICADESFHGVEHLAHTMTLYDAINIKLDKTGGLTGAIAAMQAARINQMPVMVGCMLGTSLGMAPAMLIAAGAAFVDLDGPLLLKHDRDPGLHFEGSTIHPFSSALWG